MGYIFIISIILFATITLIIRHSNKKRSKQTQLKGIRYITQLKPLISLVQQHRGLTSAWLNGDDKVKAQLHLKQKEIKKIITEINTTELQSNERWLSFNDHWDRLLTFKIKPTVSNSFEQHCSIIKNLSYLLEDSSETYLLTTDHCTHFPSIGYNWRELVVLIENIGQARAIGTGVSVQKECSSVNKIRLNFLAESIQKISTETLSNLYYLPEEVNKHNEYIKVATVKVEELIGLISKELVNNQQITIEHQHYFAMASSAMNAFDDIFYHQVEQLKKTI